MESQDSNFSPFITIELDEQLFITSISKVPTEFSDTDFLGQPFTTFLSPKEGANFLKRVNRLHKSNEPLYFIYQAPADNFEIHPFQTCLQKIDSGYRLSSMDISGNAKQSITPDQEALHKENLNLKAHLENLEKEFEIQQQYYEIFVDNAPVAMYDIDLESRIMTTNKKALEFLGLKTALEAKGHHFLEFAHDSDHERLEEHFNQALEGQEQHFTFQSNQKELQIFKSCFIPIYDFHHHVYKLFSLTEDITKEYLAEEFLKKQNSSLTLENERKDALIFQQNRHVQMAQLIKMIAHQWRQPLSVISTVTSNIRIMLELNQLNQHEIRTAMQTIGEHAEDLSEIINDFNDFYKPRKTKSKILLKDIGDKVIEVMHNSLKENGITFVRHSHASNGFCTFKNEVTQVLLNLLQNAQEVLKERHVKDPTITLTGREDESFQYIDVHDNGGGIEDDIIDKIFDPYFSTKDQKNGTGLGLHMAKTMIESHCDGLITVQNINNGAQFTIRLPNNCDI